MSRRLARFFEFVNRIEKSDRSLVVLNRTEPDPIKSMIETLFADQPVSIDEQTVPDVDEDTVVLLEDDQVVATSPLSALEEAILFVNSDIYVTGTRGIDEVSVPDAIVKLADVPFRLRGYPESNSEKLLLITISRYIEHAAWRSNGGTLRSSFQKLSRITDEIGTHAVYQRLSETNVDVHVYGQPNWTPEEGSNVTMHGGYDEAFRRTWFVVFTPDTTQTSATPDAADEAGGEEYMALLAIETDPRTWRGFWTFRREFVEEINAHIERTM